MKGDERTWLVLRAQAGDRDALDELFAQIQRRLFHYLLGLTDDRALAEDLLQDVLLLLYRKLEWLREPELFQTWAFRIASRAAFRKMARLRRLREEPLPDDADLPAEAPDVPGAFLLDTMRVHLEALSPASRAVMILHYQQSMTLQEVADILGIAPGTAKSRLAYGLRCLRRALEPEKP